MRSRRRSVVFALILLATTTATGAALGIEEIGRWPYGPATTVTRDGDLVFFGNGSTLQVLRIATADSFELLSEIVLDDGAREIVVHNNLLYITLGWHGLQIVDIADPTEPGIVATKRIGGYAYSIAISDGVAWVATVRSGIQAFDISNPTDLVRIGAVIPSTESFGLDIADGLLWAVSGEGLHAIDIADPTRPRVLSTTISSRAYEVRVVDHVAYTAADWAGLEIFDVEDPAQPVFLGRFDHGDWQTSSVEITGSTAFITSIDKLWVVDVSDPTIPVELARVEDVGYGPGRSMALEGDWLAVAHSSRGLHVLDISDHTEPEIVHIRGVAGYSSAIAAVGDVVLLASSASDGGGLRSIDVSDPLSPVQVDGPVGPSIRHAEDMVVIDDYAYVGEFSGGFHTFDVRDPTRPVFGRSLDEATSHTWDLESWDGYLLAAGGYDGLLVFDLTSPRTPSELGRFEPGNEVRGVATTDGIAAIVGVNLGLVLIDITDPTTPRLIHQHSDFGGLRVAVKDSIAYVAAHHSGLIIIDIENPFAPVEIARIEGLWVGDLAISGDRLVICAYDRDTRIYSSRFLDISNPTLPVERGFHINSRSGGLAFKDGYLAVIHNAAGFHLIDLDRVFEPGSIEEIPPPVAID